MQTQPDSEAKMDTTQPGLSPISFAEVALYFSRDEWALLTSAEKQLYEAVTMENYENVSFVASAQNQSQTLA